MAMRSRGADPRRAAPTRAAIVTNGGAPQGVPVARRVGQDGEHAPVHPAARRDRPCVVRWPAWHATAWRGARSAGQRSSPRSREGRRPEEMIVQYPSLNLAQVHAALAYCYDNPDEIEAALQEELDWEARHEQMRAEYLSRKPK